MNLRHSAAFLLLLLGVHAAVTSATEPAFPGAVGFGATTPGGRGGVVLKVTTLASIGPGSLRAALETEGPRVVVFEVGGVIDLGRQGIRVTHPFLTVAGQTAPSPGVTLIRGGLAINTHDVIVRHLAVRPGDAGAAVRSGWEPDGISLNSAHDVVIDHCSTTWAVDENLSASGPRYEGETSSRITFSNCIVAEGLNESSHHYSAHSKGTLIHDRVQDIAIIGCLYAHNDDRNPYFKIGTTGVIVNNVIYNPGMVAINLNWAPREWQGRVAPPEPRVAVVGNVLLYGQNTRADMPLLSDSIGEAFMRDNRVILPDGNSGLLRNGTGTILNEPPLWPEGLVADPVTHVVENVLKSVGARAGDRDPIDQRIIDSVREGTGRIIDSQEEVGGYPTYKNTHRELDIPAQGINAWLETFSRAVEASASSSGSAFAQTLPLWPGTPPNFKPSDLQEESWNDKVLRIRQVQTPSIDIYLPSPATATGQAVIICPGGGYRYLSYEKEGTQVAEFLAEHGIAGIVLKYRLPDEASNIEPWRTPLLDAQRALRLVRHQSDAWHLDPQRIGIMGFSAGGHLASTAGTHYDAGITSSPDPIERESSRPDYLMLVYPVISVDPEITHAGSRQQLLGPDPSLELQREFSNELQVDADTPPTFLVHAADDSGVNVQNSVSFFQALQEHGLLSELHIFPRGGHGFGLSPRPGVSQWSELGLNWLQRQLPTP